MNYLIVSNNPLAKENIKDMFFVNGSYEDVLIKVRDLVYEGVELVSHPLTASMRMLYSPYRSIILGNKNNKVDPFHMETIENSIIDYRKNLKNRKVDWKNKDDYAFVDYELLKSTFRDLEVDINKIQIIRR